MKWGEAGPWPTKGGAGAKVARWGQTRRPQGEAEVEELREEGN